MRFSLIIPVFNEEETVPLMRKRVCESLDFLGFASELIIVDDGSMDRTLEKLMEWQRSDSRVQVVELSRNFGHQRAVLAGLSVASGEIVGVIDGDLQDSPELIVKMIERLDSHGGVDVVFGVREARKEGRLLRLAYWMTYRLINSLSEIPLPLDSGDFCVMRRCVVNSMLEMGEQGLYLRGLRSWVGFKQIPFPYERSARAAGQPKYRLKDLIELAHNGIFNFTKLPLKVVGWLGVSAIVGSIAYSVFLLTAWLLGRTIPPGFSTIILAICFFSGVQFMAIGILGEYVGRIFDETRGRPRFVIRTIHKTGRSGAS